jgi:23S rRNA (cytosine1962-C5)-methyltransferase
MSFGVKLHSMPEYALCSDPQMLLRLFAAALQRRETLAVRADLTAYRLVNADADGLPGMTLDRFDQSLVLSLYVDLEPDLESQLFELIGDVFAPDAIYLKRRPREARHAANTERESLAPEDPVWGEPTPEVHVLEDGRHFLIRPGGDLSVGLFLDMRPTRTWLETKTKNKKVLNAFSYTCGFGLASSLGNAARTVNLDLSRRVLDWGEENYRLNHLEPERQDFISGNVFDWLGRMKRWKDRFDLLILDPPSFAKSRLKRFSVSAHFNDLVALAAPVIAPGGTLLACCNHSGLSRSSFLRLIESGLRDAGRQVVGLSSLGADPIDFPTLNDAEGALKVFAVQLD